MFRQAAFAAVVLAALVGVASRAASTIAGGAPPMVLDAQALEANIGETIAGAVIDAVPASEQSSVRLRMAGCADPIFVVPIEILLVATPAIADAEFGSSKFYRATDVYRGGIREGFSHFARYIGFVSARARMVPHDIETNYFTRIYSPAACAIDDQTMIAWARGVLALGAKPWTPGGH